MRADLLRDDDKRRIDRRMRGSKRTSVFVALSALIAIAIMMLLRIWPHGEILEPPRSATVPSEQPLPQAQTSSSVPPSGGAIAAATDATVLSPEGEWEKPLFTVVMLTYKAPKSLRFALGSFAEFGLLSLPQLREVLVYFQAREAKDGEMVEGWARELERLAAPNSIAPIRVIGTSANLPVAKATFEAIRQARTEIVLYLECDRPILPFHEVVHSNQSSDGDKIATIHRVRRTVEAALQAIQSGDADLFRLQLYSGDDVHEVSRTGRRILHPDIYGSDMHNNCLRAHTLTKAHCDSAKQRLGRVYNTAYCKHWRKFASPQRPQNDLCDSFCFLDWVDQFRSDNRYPKAQSVTRRQSHRSRFADQEGQQENDDVRYVCLRSDDCNFSNQPAMYRKSWYLQAIAAPCESNQGLCFGAPGRGSAVRQEVFFLKNRTAWAQRKYHICLSRGLFYHHEVDNRE